MKMRKTTSCQDGTADAKKGDHAPSPDHGELALTMAHAADTSSVDAALTNGTKQARDLAFAVALLQVGYITMRRLSSTTQTWTTYGKSFLADYLEATRVISPDHRLQAEERANLTLSRVGESSVRVDADPSRNGNATPPAASDSQRELILQLDPSGKVAKLLGIADTFVLTGDELEDRHLGSRYTLLRKLGAGGLGAVWLARDQNLQRYVAIKETSGTNADSQEGLDLFRREAEITGRLEHPGIVPVYQYGVDEVTGKSFYAMRFLGKRTLQDAIDEYHERRVSGNDEPIMLHRLLTALVNVCHSVSHAHSRKIIHRDLKPENIAVDEFGQVTIFDWGLAKVNDQTGMYDANGRNEPGDLHSVGSTRIGRVLGTPLYMAPEQAAGRLDEVDELSDVYALGGILYTILSGVAPHQAILERDSEEAGQSDLMSRIVSGDIPPPCMLNHEVRPDLSAVCMKAIQNKRYLRYESAADFAADVERCIAGTPASVYQPPVGARIRQWMSRHPSLTQSILLLVSLLMISGAAVVHTARRGRMELMATRYASLRKFARDLEVNLEFETQGLARNLHFIAQLPLMEAIIASQRTPPPSTDDVEASKQTKPTGNTDGSSAASIESREIGQVSLPSLPDGELQEGSFLPASMRDISRDAWLSRQAELFNGLLGANPGFLVACTCIQDPNGAVRELVRSERTAAGRSVHRVPRKQLNTCDPQKMGTTTSELIAKLRAEEVLLVTNDQLGDDVPVDTRSPLVLSGLLPVFDTDGDFFGLNIIELDLRRRLEELCTAIAPESVIVCVTDARGNIAIRFRDGNLSFVEGKESIAADFPQLTEFFASDAEEYGDGRVVYARRVRLGDSTAAQIGIVSHIPDLE